MITNQLLYQLSYCGISPERTIIYMSDVFLSSEKIHNLKEFFSHSTISKQKICHLNDLNCWFLIVFSVKLRNVRGIEFRGLKITILGSNCE